MNIVLVWFLKNWKVVLGAVLLISFIAWFSHARYTAGEEAGRAAVQKLWDAEAAAQREQALAAIEQAALLESEQARIAKEIQNGLQTKLNLATANARSLSERLRRYQTRPCPTAVPQTTGPTALADSTAGVTADSGAVGEATDAHFAACARDAERLAGWQVWYNNLTTEVQQ